MKNSIIISILFILSGVLLILGPTHLFKVCQTHEMIMKCHWTVQGEKGIGIIITSIGIFYLFARLKESKLLLSLVAFITYVVAILIPAVLIGGCDNNKMSCQSLTFPIIYLIAGVNIIFNILNIIYITKITKSMVFHEEK